MVTCPGRSRRRRIVASALAALVAAGVGSGAAAARSHAGERPAAKRPTVAWDELRNPVFSIAGVAVKDAAIARRGDEWVVAYSRITEPPLRFRIGWATTPDLATWTEHEPWDQPAVGGLASPSFTRLRDGHWVVTYNSHTHDVDGEEKLYYRTSRDLREFSAPTRFHVDDRDGPDDRLIDAALAQHNKTLYLAYKLGQSFRIARSAKGSLDGPWTEVGAPRVGLLENYQLLEIDGRWHLLGTTIPVHEPVLFRMDGNPERAASWLRWERVGALEVPAEAWNGGEGPPTSFETANSGTLFRSDGRWFLLYAGSTETAAFDGRGHSSLGVARSRDLVRWEVPPGGARSR